MTEVTIFTPPRPWPIRLILQAWNAGKSIAEIADDHGLSERDVIAVLRGEEEDSL